MNKTFPKLFEVFGQEDVVVSSSSKSEREKKLEDIVKEMSTWIAANPPVDGMGGIDKQREKEGLDLIDAADQVLNEK